MNLSTLLSQLGLVANLTIVPQLQDQLPDPILVYYDEDLHDLLTSVVRGLFSTRSRSLYVQKTNDTQRPILPSPLNQVYPRSTVLLGKDPARLLTNLRYWRFWDARRNLLIILPVGSDPLLWITLAWKITRAINVVAVVIDTPVHFFAWFPYKENTCTEIINIADVFPSKLFPVKIPKNLHRCPFIAIASSLGSMVKSETEGIETRIVVETAKKLNLTLKYRYLKDSWNLFDTADGTPILAMKNVVENEIDITFCSLRVTKEAALWTDFLTPYLDDETSWFVPSPKKISRATAMYKAFTLKAWALVACSFAAILITVLFFNKIEKGHSGPIVDTLAFTLNLSTNLPESRAFRIFAIAAYVYSLHITTAYLSSLTIFLTDIPRELPIRTPEDLADSSCRIQFLHGHREEIESRTEGFFKKLRSRCSYVGWLRLFQVPNGNLALLGAKRALMHYIDINHGNLFKDEYGYTKVLVLKEPFDTSLLTMYMSLGHPLVPVLRRYFIYLIEGGFPQHFSVLENSQPKSVMRGNEPFNWENVEGAFYLLFLCSAFSTTVFFIELIVFKISNEGGRRHRIMLRKVFGW